MTLILGSPTRNDVLPQDADVLVSVGAALLVFEAQRVQQLVLHHVMIQAALTLQRQSLLIETPAHVGEAPDR